jgi:pyridoxine kinase
VETLSDALKAIEILHEMGPSIVLVTSFREKPGELTMIASNKTNIYKITTPELPLGSGIAGTGDMTAAVFLSHYLDTKDLEKTLLRCTASVFCVLEESYNFSLQMDNIPLELRIINAQEQFICPSKFFNTVKIR